MKVFANLIYSKKLRRVFVVVVVVVVCVLF